MKSNKEFSEMKKMIKSAVSIILAASLAAVCLCACGGKSKKSSTVSDTTPKAPFITDFPDDFEGDSIVKTAEAEKLTARIWETNYSGHLEVLFKKNGDLLLNLDEVGDRVEVAGKWSINGTTLTVTTYKTYNEDGNLVDSTRVDTYEYADYLNDEVFEGGDQAVAEATKDHKDDPGWYVSDNYLCFGNSVWIPLQTKSE